VEIRWGMMNLSANRARGKKFSRVILNLINVNFRAEMREYELSRVSHLTRSAISLAFSPGRGIYSDLAGLYISSNNTT